MTEWHADERFLSFLEETIKPGELISYAGKNYTLLELIREMNEGSRLGRFLYQEMQQDYKIEFEDHLVNKLIPIL